MATFPVDVSPTSTPTSIHSRCPSCLRRVKSHQDPAYSDKTDPANESSNLGQSRPASSFGDSGLEENVSNTPSQDEVAYISPYDGMSSPTRPISNTENSAEGTGSAMDTNVTPSPPGKTENKTIVNLESNAPTEDSTTGTEDADPQLPFFQLPGGHFPKTFGFYNRPYCHNPL